jgi:tetratricopeptide (TPR) repeat protein
MDALVVSQIDARDRPFHETDGGFHGRARLRDGGEDAPVVRGVTVSIQEPDAFALDEGPGDVVHRLRGTALADVGNELQEVHGRGNTTIPALMAVYFPQEIVPGAWVPRSDILDRRETDFKADELVVRQDDNPEVSPKSMELLRQGEALYDRGLYHEAVHVWTRILFLDRGNPEARLRIDRAKEAIAERERRLDADLAEAKALFESGNLREARERVRSVLSVDGGHSEAVALEAAIEELDRRNDPPRGTDALAGLAARPAAPLNGAEVAAAVPPMPAQGVVFRVPKVSRPSSGRSRPSVTSRFQMTAFVLVSLSLFAAALLYLRENWDAIVSDGAYAHPSGLAPAVLPERLAASVPDLSELRYYNGQRLFTQGRYREALAELRLVDRDSRVVSEARSLVLRIEERLLRDPAGREAAIEAPR